MSETIKDLCDPLGDLYGETGEDWSMSIGYCLTEPLCPTVEICPEGWDIARYRVYCETVEEGVQRAVAHVRREIIDRVVIGQSAPFTNSDDADFEKWLLARAAGSSDPLPERPEETVA